MLRTIGTLEDFLIYQRRLQVPMGDDLPFRGKWPDFLNYNYGVLDLLQVEMRMAGVRCVCELCRYDIFFSG